MTCGYNHDLYRLNCGLHYIPLLVPGLLYHYEIGVECVDENGGADAIRIFVCNPRRYDHYPLLVAALSSCFTFAVNVCFQLRPSDIRPCEHADQRAVARGLSPRHDARGGTHPAQCLAAGGWRLAMAEQRNTQGRRGGGGGHLDRGAPRPIRNAQCACGSGRRAVIDSSQAGPAARSAIIQATGQKRRYWLVLKEIIRAAPCFFLHVLAWYQ
jgi:hypothetical protein